MGWDKSKSTCIICQKEFKNNGDQYCSKTCLNSSITDEEQLKAIEKFKDEMENCPICGRNKKFLIHKRMNGQWYLYQEYHYDNNKRKILTCYSCNLWERDYRKRTGRNITPEEHRRLIRNDTK